MSKSLLSKVGIIFNLFITGVAACLFSSLTCAELSPLLEEEMDEIVGQAGVTVSIELDATTDYLSITDTDGVAGNTQAGTVYFNDFSFTSDGPLTFDLDLDGSYDHDNNAATAGRSAIALNFADVSASDAGINFGTLQFANNKNAFGYIQLKGIHLKNTKLYAVSGGASGQGITMNLETNVRIDDLKLVDSADENNPGTGTAAVGLSGITLNSDYTSNSPTVFKATGLTIDVDATKGLVIGLPSIEGDIALEKIHAGGESGAGIAFRDIDIGGGKLYVRAH